MSVEGAHRAHPDPERRSTSQVEGERGRDGGRDRDRARLSGALIAPGSPFHRTGSPLRAPKAGGRHLEEGGGGGGSPFSKRGGEGIFGLEQPPLPLGAGSRGSGVAIILLLVCLSIFPVAFYWGTQCRYSAPTVPLMPTKIECSCKPEGNFAPASSTRDAAAATPAATSGMTSAATASSALPLASLPLAAAAQQPQGLGGGSPGGEEASAKGGLPDLEEVIRRVGGADRTIVYGSTSADYLDLTENWFLSIQRQGLGSRVMFVAEDDAAMAHLQARWPGQTVMAHQLWGEVHDKDGRTAKDKGIGWNTAYYNSLVDRRPEYFLALLRRNVTFLYNDVDVVWLGNPFPYFVGNFDLWVQEDTYSFGGALKRFATGTPQPPLPGHVHNLCTCFMMLRPTPGTVRLIAAWNQFLKDAMKKWKAYVVNQPAFNQVLKKLKPEDVTVGVLPVGNFPSGCLYFRRPEHPECRREHNKYWDAVDAKKTKPVAVHNNWVKGKAGKIDSFQTWNLWLQAPSTSATWDKNSSA